MARTRRQRGGQVDSEDSIGIENDTSGANDTSEKIPENAPSVPKRISTQNSSMNNTPNFNIPTGLPNDPITKANNNNNTRRQVRSKLLAFQKKLESSQASGATGPVMYDKELLIDQLFLLNNTLQPLRAIVREADTLMDMIKLGTSQAMVQRNYNTRNIIQKRIQDKVKNTTKKKGRDKKMKLKNIEKLFE